MNIGHRINSCMWLMDPYVRFQDKHDMKPKMLDVMVGSFFVI